MTTYDAMCLRKISNWTTLEKEHKFDKETFDPKKFMMDLPVASPKLMTLLTKIKELDDQDVSLYGRKFKHFIFSEVKAGGYGAKVVCSGLMAAGLNLCYTPNMLLKSEDELMSQRADNFGYLCSTTVYEQPLPTTLKKGMLELFNRRPSNIYGDLVRIMVADGGFKEGIDLFDVKYVHLFEPLVSEADQKQAIGRATRKCGQAGLQFVPMVGWTLNVYVYDTLLSEKLLAKLDSNSLFDMYLANSKFDLRKMNFGKQLEQLVVVGAVDYPLNKNLISIGQATEADGEDPLFGGAEENLPNSQNASMVKNETVSLNVNANANANAKTEPLNVNQGTNTIVQQPINGVVGNTTSLPQPLQKARRSPVPPKLGDKVYCHRMCSINRPSKYVPVSLPLFAAVAIIIGAPLPDKRTKKPRAGFCELLKSNNEYCSNVKAAFADPRGYIRNNSNALLEAIEGGVHLKLGKSVRYPFLRYVYKFLPKVAQDKIVDMPNVQRALDTENAPVNVSVHSANTNTNVSAKVDATTSNAVNVTVVSNALNASVDKSATSRRASKRSFIRDGFRYMLENVPRFTEKMDFVKTREFIVDNYGPFKWEKPQLENGCKNTWDVVDAVNASLKTGGASGEISADINAVSNLLKEMEEEIEKAEVGKNDNIKGDLKPFTKSVVATFTPTQDFLRHYFTPDNPYKGMLLWHSVGTGKTCSAIATATSSFEREGWTILWVTRTTLKDDIWKNMFDTVCSLSMQEKMAKGARFPSKLTDRMRYVPDNWSIRPMSYKQFTNLISANNQQYHQLVKKNGQEDPLKKTLLIIDEAHKLYGGYDLLPAEKPDMRKLKAALNNSYAVSGKDSVKLLLMTATPYAQDPMELVKLVNLVKEPFEQLPTTFSEFEHVFLDEKTGKFTKDGKKAFLTNINGVISFLDRGSDAREFAQPKIELVNVKMSLRPSVDIEGLRKEVDFKVSTLKTAIKELDERFADYKKVKMAEYRELVRAKCGKLKGQEYLDCKNDKTPQMQRVLDAIEGVMKKVTDIKTNHSQAIKKIVEDFNLQREIYENSISQEHVLDTKCNRGYKPTINKKSVGLESYNP